MHEDETKPPADEGRLDRRVRPAVAEASERDEWQSAVFVLMGHAAGLYADGKHDMPAWCYELAEKIARTHLDEAHALRVRQVAVQQRVMYGEPA